MYSIASLDLMVATPLILSLSIAKIGLLARPSILFNSLLVVTNMFLTRRKYQIKGGMITSITGMAATAVTREPPTRNAHMKKSKRVCGKRSSLDPTSALKRLRIRPLGFVSKNSIFALSTALDIASCNFFEALSVREKLVTDRKSENKHNPPPRARTGPTIDAER
jgi:hypothetical protein